MKLAGVEGLGDVGVGGVWGGKDDVGEVGMVSACCSCGEWDWACVKEVGCFRVVGMVSACCSCGVWDWACVKEVGCFRELLGSSNVSFSLSSR